MDRRNDDELVKARLTVCAWRLELTLLYDNKKIKVETDRGDNRIVNARSFAYVSRETCRRGYRMHLPRVYVNFSRARDRDALSSNRMSVVLVCRRRFPQPAKKEFFPCMSGTTRHNSFQHTRHDDGSDEAHRTFLRRRWNSVDAARGISRLRVWISCERACSPSLE